MACQLDFLGDCLSGKECRDALGQLPPSLNESYMRILQRVPTGKERIVPMILNFIAYADPNLDVPILREALSVPEKVGKDDVLNAQFIIREDSITRLCRSLIRKSNDGHRYEFAHFSVQEFLAGEMQSLPEFETFKISKSICQLLLTKQCLKYLLLRNFSYLPTEEREIQEHIDMRVKDHPFYFYAAVCWPLFARSHWMDEDLVDLAKIPFQPNKTVNFTAWALELMSFFAWQCSEHEVDEFQTASWRTALHEDHAKYTLELLPQLVDKTFTTLHMAAALSLPVVCSSLIDQEGSINRQSPFGCPLQCAVQGLFMAGIYEDDEDRLFYIEPYYQASYWEEHIYDPDSAENTIRLFLDSGAADISACSSPFAGQRLITVAVKLALSLENIGAVVVLLEAGYEPEDNISSQITSIRQNLVDINALRDYDHDPLRLKSLVLCLDPMIGRSAAHFRLCQAVWSLAIEMGCEFARDPSIVDLRISLSQDSLNKTIFTSILDADIRTLDEALKDPRAKIAGLTDNENETVFEKLLKPPRWAKLLDTLKMISLLLSAGMEVNQQNQEGLLPIHELARWKRINDDGSYYDALSDIISEFARRGTGCTARSRANQNVFHLGLWSIGFIKAVLEAETDENILTALRTQDGDGFTPITRAIEAGQEEMPLLASLRGRC